MPIRPRSTPTFAGLTRAALALWILVAAAFATVPALAQRPAEASSWVWRDQTSGRLLYRTTAAGDRIPDFSGTGYMGGTQPVPDVETIVPHKRRVTVAPPASGDATPAIQAAIARVAAWPADLKGYRGLIQLSPGTYNIEGQIRIQTGGIILRGTPKTLLRAVGTDQRSLIAVGPDAGERAEIPGTRSEVADNYVPVGTTTLRVMQPGRFPAGSQVVVFRPATAEWIDAIGMNRIEVGKKGRRVNQWVGGGVLDQHYERTVERTVGDRLFLDAPLTNSLDRRHGPAYVYRYDFPGRIERIGLVNLHGEAVYDRSVLDRAGRETDEEHSSSFIDVDRTRNAW